MPAVACWTPVDQSDNQRSEFHFVSGTSIATEVIWLQVNILVPFLPPPHHPHPLTHLKLAFFARSAAWRQSFKWLQAASLMSRRMRWGVTSKVFEARGASHVGTSYCLQYVQLKSEKINITGVLRWVFPHFLVLRHCEGSSTWAWHSFPGLYFEWTPGCFAVLSQLHCPSRKYIKLSSSTGVMAGLQQVTFWMCFLCKVALNSWFSSWSLWSISAILMEAAERLDKRIWFFFFNKFDYYLLSLLPTRLKKFCRTVLNIFVWLSLFWNVPVQTTVIVLVFFQNRV